jgi:hypothetical protein
MAVGFSIEQTAVYERLIIADLWHRLPGAATGASSATDIREIGNLIAAASRLALQDDHEERTLAFEVATRAAAVFGHEFPGVVKAAEVILARLGNFPGRDLLQSRFGEALTGCPLLTLEMKAREVENSVPDASGRPRRLTDFQFDTFERSRSFRR